MKRRIFAGLQILLRRNGFQWRKIACFLAASYILLVFLSLFLVIGIIFEEVRPLLASLQLQCCSQEHLLYQRSLFPCSNSHVITGAPRDTWIKNANLYARRNKTIGGKIFPE